MEDKVEYPLFLVVQINRSVKTEDDIRSVFIKAGVPARDYDTAKNSPEVQALTAAQDEAAKAYSVTGTPSFFVKGKYLVNNAGIPSSGEQDYGKSFAEVVSMLLKQHQQE